MLPLPLSDYQTDSCTWISSFSPHYYMSLSPHSPSCTTSAVNGQETPKKRILQLPEAMQATPRILLKKVKYVIPKFHLHNHGLKCHLWFNLNFLRYLAQSDLEDPKRWWAYINPISMSTREMTRGSHINILNDHAAGWNWRKTTVLGEYCW